MRPSIAGPIIDKMRVKHASLRVDAFYFCSKSRISVRSLTSSVGPGCGGAGSSFFSLFIPFIAKNKILAAMLNLVTFYRIEPTWIRLIDNSRGFGHKEELHLQLSTS